MQIWLSICYTSHLLYYMDIASNDDVKLYQCEMCYLDIPKEEQEIHTELCFELQKQIMEQLSGNVIDIDIDDETIRRMDQEEATKMEELVNRIRMEELDRIREEEEIDRVRLHEVIEKIRLEEVAEAKAEAKKKEEPIPFTQVQEKALEYSFKKARVFNKNITPNLIAKVQGLGGTVEDVRLLRDYIKNRAPIIIHVRIPTINLLLKDTHYRSLFEIHSSGGSMDTSARNTWEQVLFNKIYDGCEPHERVKYGVVNIMNDPAGVTSARAYGDCYFVLNENVRKRTTFIVGDSSSQEMHLCTLPSSNIMLYLLSDELLKKAMDISAGKLKCSKNDNYSYIEIQVHGDIRLDRDIKELVVPGAHKSCGDTVRTLDQFEEKFGVPYSFH